MSEQDRRHPGDIDPADQRLPGPGGGEQPATHLLTNEPVGLGESRSGFDVGPAGDSFDDGVALVGAEDDAPRIARMLEEARAQLGDAVFVLEEGSEIFNTAGLRVLTKTPTVVVLSEPSGDPRTNDQQFAGFLHPSDQNWGLNIKQLGRSFNRATCVPLPLFCEEHGEDLEVEAYGAPRPCPKCAQEALKAAAAAAADAPPSENPATPAEPEPPADPAEPIKAGDVVVRIDVSEQIPPLEMTVLSVEFGIANCQWFDEGGLQTQEKTFGVSVLRKVR